MRRTVGESGGLSKVAAAQAAAASAIADATEAAAAASKAASAAAQAVQSAASAAVTAWLTSEEAEAEQDNVMEALEEVCFYDDDLGASWNSIIEIPFSRVLYDHRSNPFVWV